MGREQWCIPVFVGVEARRGSGTEQLSSTSRVATGVTSSEDLRTMQAAGQRLLTEFASGFEPVRGSVNLSGQTPTATASVSDQPRLMPAPNVMMGVVNREARLPLYIPPIELMGFVALGG